MLNNRISTASNDVSLLMARTPIARPRNHSPPHSRSLDKQGAYFLSLTVKNVRCFGQEQTLNLSDGKGKPARWTVILGLNGTGKTTLLQLLAGYFMVPSVNSTPGERGYHQRFQRFDQPTFLRCSEFPPQWTGTICASESLLESPRVSIPADVELQASGIKFGHSPVSWNVWGSAYGASRRFGVTTLIEDGEDDPTASLFSDRADLRNPEEWLLRLDYAAAKKSDIQAALISQLDVVKGLLLEILPEITDIRLTTPDEKNPTPRVEFETPYGWVPLPRLGYGYQTLVTWVTDLANRMVEFYPDSKTPLSEPAIVLVDEIDLHLHPAWQRKLMDFLSNRFTNTQFIATAHSPLMAQGTDELNLAVLRRVGNQIVIDNDVDNIRNWRVDQILTSDLFGLPSARPRQIEALLEQRKSLLQKPKLTAADRRVLKDVEAKIGELPIGETPEEIAERKEVREALDLLMKERQAAK